MSAVWTREALLAATGGRFSMPFDAHGVSIDTRTLEPGDLFVALQGDNGDGHDHAEAALARGAAGVLAHRDGPGPRLLVNDTMSALQALGRFARDRFHGTVFAVTGSVGKTTTKEMLRTALAPFGPVHAAYASYNNHWGVPLTLARLPESARSCVVEIGMNHAGEIAPLAALARPHVAIITTVERSHIGHLGSIEAIADEKAALFSGLEADGVAIMPADSPMLPRLMAQAAPHRVMTFGTDANSMVRLRQIEAATDSSKLDLVVRGQSLSCTIGAPGRHMAMNALAALAAVDAAGFDPHPAAAALENFHALAGRGAKRSIALNDGQAVLLDESYNASSASIRAALDVLRLTPASRRIVVLGDILELGDQAVAEHAGLAQDIAACADLVFTCGPMMRHLFDALPASVRGAHEADSVSLAPVVSGAIRDGDAILVKGSFGSRMRIVTAALGALTHSIREGAR
ncbi:UDP-N-acetylmuramoyl-tripeptide--D-alanyl-D-alanine ligase [Granulibacter bethesdensis]|uniref:UDP-N-acetylmuramoyl-tripeptide--D-alanyl-D-alanine ligase n=1 Tax=Granulibacter bethesdensis TaxID=364410 RepID=A0AAN0VF17_9PROT|nr:UDP-N-acetylmuramoyl-tripeptide--D-alanyl-D-alanine ligase [Granulibacter bethesdensis]AHJ62202.1 UDP-N-acetylmuramoyl-tripeptide--D-alanyl-D-alanine ligase [Granulibacter bethesdensis]